MSNVHRKGFEVWTKNIYKISKKVEKKAEFNIRFSNMVVVEVLDFDLDSFGVAARAGVGGE